MAYTFAAMPTPQSTTAEQIVNAITSIQTAVNDLDSRVSALDSTVGGFEARVSGLEAQDAVTSDDLTNVQDELGLIRGDITALQAGGVPNAITSPDGSVTSIEVGTATANSSRSGLPNTHLLLDRG